MFLECERQQEYPDKTHMDTERNMQTLHMEETDCYIYWLTEELNQNSE